MDPSVVDAEGVYRMTGRARVFTSERDAITAVKGQGGVYDTDAILRRLRDS